MSDAGTDASGPSGTLTPAASVPVHAEAELEARAAARGQGRTVTRLRPVRGDPSAVRRLTPVGQGHQLDPGIRAALLARVGHHFGDVRIHADREADALAVAAGARAYAVGHHIVFRDGLYRPRTPEGQGLLEHELHHVAQQHGSQPAVLRDDAKTPALKTPAPDPEPALGAKLAKDFPTGVALAFYAPMPDANEEAEKAAKKWAGRENALAIKGKGAPTAAKVVFGDAMNEDDHPLTATIQALGKVLASAVAKAPPDPAGPLPPGMGPATVRTLAVFAHGTSNWCGLGAITSSAAAGVIKAIAPNLAPTVTVVLYSCNAGRNPDDSEEWVKGTMQPGGAKSLAAATRDALIAEGKSGSVWGHTTTGHVTENFALREFDTTGGKGSAGASFVGRYVFSAADRLTLATELLNGVTAAGYEVTSAKSSGDADALAEAEMYRGYAEANAKLTYAGGKLAESAPVHPVDVGKAIKTYWDATYWPARKATAIEKLAKALVASGRAKKAKATPVTPAKTGP
jgi:Domain of unknown function (DUF4157)